MMNGLAVVWEQREIVVLGLGNTALLTLLCFALSLPFAMAATVVFRESNGAVKRAGQLLVDLMRCVPFLLLAYVVYFGLPEVGLRFDAWGSGLATLVLYHTAYLTEILRSAALALPRDDLEAARAFGFTAPTLYRRIVFPQIMVSSAPLIGNQVIMILKDTALLMIITVQELSFAANFINTNYFTPFAPFAVAMALYWGLCLVVEAGVRRLGRLQRLRHG